MKSLFAATVIATALPLRACLGPQVTTIELQNDTQFPVEVEVFYDDDQNILEDLLEAGDPDLELTLPAGGGQSFSSDCDDLQAVMVRGDLQVLGGLGPSETTRVYRDGDDFGCGDAIRFTFSSAIPTDLDISFSQRPR